MFCDRVWEIIHPGLRDILEGSIKIEVDDVAALFLSGGWKEKFTANDIPNIAPPFLSTPFWMEYKRPSIIMKDMVLPKNVGCLNCCEQLPDKQGWKMIQIGFFSFDHKMGIVQQGWIQNISPEGKVGPYYFRSSSNEESTKLLVNDFKWPFLLALAFLNCKGTRLKGITEEKKTRKQRKAHQKGKPYFRYHRLFVPVLQTIRETMQGKGVDLKRALHLCRGHFKTFTADGPLFGKYEGTFYWPDHIRGNKKKGIIVSDYIVKPPEGDLFRGSGSTLRAAEQTPCLPHGT